MCQIKQLVIEQYLMQKGNAWPTSIKHVLLQWICVVITWGWRLFISVTLLDELNWLTELPVRNCSCALTVNISPNSSRCTRVCGEKKKRKKIYVESQQHNFVQLPNRTGVTVDWQFKRPSQWLTAVCSVLAKTALCSPHLKNCKSYNNSDVLPGAMGRM